jgi:hypothetical protein
MAKQLKTVNIKGKQYVEVNERVRYFRENFAEGAILTEVVSHTAHPQTGKMVIMFKADIYVNGVLVARAHSQEKECDGFINATSYVENGETSAIGRALGVFGIGIDGSVASADEVQNAILQQSQPVEETVAQETMKFAFKSKAELNRTISALCECYAHHDQESLDEIKSEMTKEQKKHLNSLLSSDEHYHGIPAIELLDMLKSGVKE